MTAIDTPRADMTNIRAIHPPITSDGAHRLLGSLRDAHAKGKALGPRAPHIRALCLSLERLLESLRSSSAALMRELDDHKVFAEELRQELDMMIAPVEHIVTIVRALEADDPKHNVSKLSKIYYL